MKAVVPPFGLNIASGLTVGAVSLSGSAIASSLVLSNPSSVSNLLNPFISSLSTPLSSFYSQVASGSSNIWSSISSTGSYFADIPSKIANLSTYIYQIPTGIPKLKTGLGSVFTFLKSKIPSSSMFSIKYLRSFIASISHPPEWLIGFWSIIEGLVSGAFSGQGQEQSSGPQHSWSLDTLKHLFFSESSMDLFSALGKAAQQGWLSGINPANLGDALNFAAGEFNKKPGSENGVVKSLASNIERILKENESGNKSFSELLEKLKKLSVVDIVVYGLNSLVDTATKALGLQEISQPSQEIISNLGSITSGLLSWFS